MTMTTSSVVIMNSDGTIHHLIFSWTE